MTLTIYLSVLNRAFLHIAAIVALGGLMLLLSGLGNSIAINNLNHPHLSVSCGSCHNLQSRTQGAGADSSAARATYRCLECHGATLAQESPQSVFHQTGDHCANCHSFHQPKKLLIGGDSTTLSAVEAEAAICDDCHRSTAMPEIIPGHREAAKLIHSEFATRFGGDPNRFCLACHDASPGVQLASSEFVPPRLHMTASHTYDTRLIPGSQLPGSDHRIQDQIPESIRTIDGNMSCLSCHSMVSANRQLLVTTIEDGLCTSCHDMQRRPGSPIFSLE